MNTELVLNPCEIANGEMSRKEITATVNESAKNTGLLPLDHVRYYRELGKGATDAEKLKNTNGVTITQLAIAQAKKLPEYKRAIKEGKKESLYNGCYYQIREDESVDMSAVPEQEEAQVWLTAKAAFDAIEKQIADLRTDQNTWKTAMEGEEAKYIAAHPKCKKNIMTTLVVL